MKSQKNFIITTLINIILKQKKIIFYSKNEDIIERLKNILNQENQSKEYKTNILNVFKDLILYIKKRMK